MVFISVSTLLLTSESLFDFSQLSATLRAPVAVAGEKFRFQGLFSTLIRGP